MKKALCLALAFAVLIGCLAGCSGSKLTGDAKELGKNAVKIADEFISGKVDSLEGREKMTDIMTALNDMDAPEDDEQAIQQGKLITAVLDLYLTMGEGATEEEIREKRKAIQDLL